MRYCAGQRLARGHNARVIRGARATMKLVAVDRPLFFLVCSFSSCGFRNSVFGGPTVKRRRLRRSVREGTRTKKDILLAEGHKKSIVVFTFLSRWRATLWPGNSPCSQTRSTSLFSPCQSVAAFLRASVVQPFSALRRSGKQAPWASYLLPCCH
jgi:hypothetical protein